ncbi:hypothetical protein D3C85_443940 [compost metagenome]
MGAGQHLDDAAFAAPTPIQAGNPRQGTVTIEDQAHLRRAKEQIIAAVVRNQKAEAVAVAADAAEDQVQLVHRRIGAAAGVDQLAVAFHGAQPTAQRLDLLFGGQAELVEQLLTVRRRATLGEVLQNQFATRDGIFVFFRFTSGLRVEGLPVGH